MTKQNITRKMRAAMLNATIRKAVKEAKSDKAEKVVLVGNNPEEGFIILNNDKALSRNPKYNPQNVIGKVHVWKDKGELQVKFFSRHQKKKITKSMVSRSVKLGYIPEDAERGYGFFSSERMDGAEFVQGIDEMHVFKSDQAVILQAKIDGVPIIDDVPENISEADKASDYIDTPENREVISAYLRKCYGISWA